MDRFIKIDPATSFLKKTVIAERDGALIELYPNFLPSYEATQLYKELKNLTDWKIGETMTKGGMKKTSRLIMGLVNPNVNQNVKLEDPVGSSADSSSSASPKRPLHAARENIIKASDELPNTPAEAETQKESYDVFPPLLMAAHEKIKELTGETFNYAYLNYYRDGNDHIGFHSDKEDTLEAGSTIASLSLGATRDFIIRHIGDTRLAQNMSDDKLRVEALEAAKETISLKAGSLLLMKKLTQKVYHHHVPKRINVKSPRINITFRHIRDSVES